MERDQVIDRQNRLPRIYLARSRFPLRLDQGEGQGEVSNSVRLRRCQLMNNLKAILATWGVCLLSSGLCPPASGQVVSKIAVGYGHSLFLEYDGSLWGMGFNYNGELGNGANGETARRFSPVPIVPLPPFPAILDLNFFGTDLMLHATNGLAGGTYYVLMSTNATLPLRQWTRAATTLPVANGAFTLTAINAFAPNDSQRFYTLQLLR